MESLNSESNSIQEVEIDNKPSYKVMLESFLDWDTDMTIDKVVEAVEDEVQHRLQEILDEGVENSIDNEMKVDKDNLSNLIKLKVVERSNEKLDKDIENLRQDNMNLRQAVAESDDYGRQLEEQIDNLRYDIDNERFKSAEFFEPRIEKLKLILKDKQESLDHIEINTTKELEVASSVIREANEKISDLSKIVKDKDEKIKQLTVEATNEALTREETFKENVDLKVSNKNLTTTVKLLRNKLDFIRKNGLPANEWDEIKPAAASSSSQDEPSSLRGSIKKVHKYASDNHSILVKTFKVDYEKMIIMGIDSVKTKPGSPSKCIGLDCKKWISRDAYELIRVHKGVRATFDGIIKGYGAICDKCVNNDSFVKVALREVRINVNEQ